MENNLMNSNEKRLQSLKSLKKTYQNQKLIIQSALSNIDKGSHKIIFDEDLEDPSTIVKSNTEKQGQALFDNDSDDNFDVDFSIKKQFEGETGQKLLELQSRYKNDKRFVLSGTFLDDAVEDTVIENGFEQDDEEISLEMEKKRELEILDQILQKHQSKPKLSIKKKKVEGENKFMVRFDPSQPQHTKYEMKKEEIQAKKNKKEATKRLSDISETKKSQETESPEVSKTVFYEVKGNLKDTLHTNNQVSLLSMFGIANENVHEDMEEEKEENQVRITKLNFTNEKNPFKYDSSDDEEEDHDSKKQDTKKILNGLSQKEEGSNNKINFWVETFFFKEDDYRLQEGFDFVERMKLEDNSDFSKSRRELKDIVRTKIRNVQQKKKMFKRKIGGSKRRRKDIRIKKALKK